MVPLTRQMAAVQKQSVAPEFGVESLRERVMTLIKTKDCLKTQQELSANEAANFIHTLSSTESGAVFRKLAKYGHIQAVLVLFKNRQLTEDEKAEVVRGAVKSGNLKLVIEAIYQMQEPPLDFFREIVPSAAASGHLEVFTWLLKYKSKMKKRAISQTALHLGSALCSAAAKNHGDVVQWILKEIRIYTGPTTFLKSGHGIPYICPCDAYRKTPPSSSALKEERKDFILPDDLLAGVRRAAQNGSGMIVQEFLKNVGLCERLQLLAFQEAAAKGMQESSPEELACALMHEWIFSDNCKTLEKESSDRITMVAQKLGFNESSDRIRSAVQILAAKNSLYDQISLAVQKKNYGLIHHYVEKSGMPDALPGLIIQEAAARGENHVIKMMILLNFPITEADRGRAVQVAAAKGHQKIVRRLLESGNIPDSDRESAAKMTNSGEIVQMLQLKTIAIDQLTIAKSKKKVGYPQECFDIAFIRAAENGRSDVVQGFLQKNAFSAAVLGRALRCAAAKGQLKVVQQLQPIGTILVDDRQAAAENAKAKGHEEIVKLLN